MDIKKVLFMSLVALAILASFSAVSAGFLDALYGAEPQDNVVEIDHITFNMTNATEFELYNETEGYGGYFKWFIDENKTGYNVHIYNYSKGFNDIEGYTWNDALKDSQGDRFDGVPSQTVNGIVVYTKTANVGDNVGTPRYVSFVENRDAKTYVEIWSPDPNETSKMALSIKFK